MGFFTRTLKDQQAKCMKTMLKNDLGNDKRAYYQTFVSKHTEEQLNDDEMEKFFTDNL